MQEDAELLREYAATHSQAAFAELVRRHLGLVYSVALRQTYGDIHLAEDVTQQVFVACAAKAAALSRHPVVSGWLYRSTRYRAIDALRGEQRRRTREQQSLIMNELTTPSAPEGSYDGLRPVLDEVISELDAADRDAVTLRFFENRGFAEIGARLRLNENAARMRVERALGKLQARLASRGITSTAAALTTVLAEQTMIAAPAGLASSVVSGVITATSAASLGSGTITTLITMAKLKSATIAALALAGTVAIMFQHQSNTALAAKVERVRRDERDLSLLKAENRRLEQTAREAATYANDGPEMARMQNEAAALASRSVKRPPVVSGPIFDLKELDVVPAAKTLSPAVFPRELKASGVSGEAKVSFVLDAEGNVHDVEIASSSHPLLADAALAAVSKWKYDPGYKGGAPVNVRMETTMNFRLAQGPSSAPAPVKFWFPSP